MTDCEFVAKYGVVYCLGRKLSPEERDRIARHLGVCEECEARITLVNMASPGSGEGRPVGDTTLASLAEALKILENRSPVAWVRAVEGVVRITTSNGAEYEIAPDGKGGYTSKRTCPPDPW
jgi:hypothetical protein